jgi:SAM-dependent methyltransferase
MIDERDGAWLIDFDGSRCFRSTTGLRYRYERDRDRRLFNRLYGADLLTEEAVRRVMKSEGRGGGEGWYAPIDFGSGLTVGHFWSFESGTGRWETITRQAVADLVKGRRVLDLGSNNGIFPMLMLQSGAREVLGIERSPEFIRRAELVKRVFEWRDQRRYGLHMYEGDMRDATTRDWGPLDVVTAFCSLYYLEADQMAEIVRWAADHAPVIVLQGNDSTRAEAGHDKAAKSSSAFLEELLRRNGFERVEVHRGRGHPRPILIGFRKQGSFPRHSRTHALSRHLA